jgi:hypothetical protein
MLKWVTSLSQARRGSARGESSPCAVPGRAVRGSIAMVLLVPHLTGCFQFVPVSRSDVPSGAEVSLGITDPGRVALAEPIGPGISRVDGRIVENRDTSIVLAVTSVRFIDLDVTMYRDGERVEIAHRHISEIRERRLSQSRSWIAAGVAAAGVAALLLISIVGFGGEDIPDRPGNGDGDQT